jgi:hypothetical protein
MNNCLVKPAKSCPLERLVRRGPTRNARRLQAAAAPRTPSRPAGSMGRPLGWNPKPTFACLGGWRSGQKTSHPRPPVHATTQRFITRRPPTQPRVRRCARIGRRPRFARANLRHNARRQTTSNLHLGFSVRLTFELSGALPTAKPAVRCPLERGVGRQAQVLSSTFRQRALSLLDLRALCQPCARQATMHL